MIAKSEGDGLAIRGLDPSLKRIVGAIASERALILTRANYARYSNAGGDVLIMEYTFYPQTLAPGDQIRIVAGGLASNNTGAPQAVGAYARISQGANINGPIVGTSANAPTSGVQHFGWRSEISLSVNVPFTGTSQYVPQIGTKAVTTNDTYSTGLQPVEAVFITGWGDTLVSDNSRSGGTQAGGMLLNTVAGPGTGSRFFGLESLTIYDNNYPIVIRVYCSGAAPAANADLIVLSGYMEGL